MCEYTPENSVFRGPVTILLFFLLFFFTVHFDRNTFDFQPGNCTGLGGEGVNVRRICLHDDCMLCAAIPPVSAGGRLRVTTGRVSRRLPEADYTP